MRNASATFDNEFGFDPPARKKTTRKPGSRSAGKKKKKGKTFPFDRVARYAAIGMSATVVVGIMVNALMMQKGHHPAPLFAKSTRLNDAAPTAAGASMAETVTAAATPIAPMPAPRVDVAATKVPAATTVGKAQRAPSADSDATPTSDDAIGRLLKTGSASGASASEKTDARTILAVQKALGKLGFSVKATGAVGPATKKAIEAFERDRHLPVKGELSHHHLVRTLAAESGMRID